MWISKKHMAYLEKADRAAYRSPVPTQMVSNGEYMPLAQTKAQREVQQRIQALAAAHGKKLGLSRREFLRTSSGMAARLPGDESGVRFALPGGSRRGR